MMRKPWSIPFKITRTSWKAISLLLHAWFNSVVLLITKGLKQSGIPTQYYSSKGQLNTTLYNTTHYIYPTSRTSCRYSDTQLFIYYGLLWWQRLKPEFMTYLQLSVHKKYVSEEISLKFNMIMNCNTGFATGNTL